MTDSSQRPAPVLSDTGHKANPNMKAGVPKQEEEQLKQWFIGAIDQGTTSSRFLIFDGTGKPVAAHQIEFKQMYPHSGWVGYTIDLKTKPRRLIAP